MLENDIVEAVKLAASAAESKGSGAGVTLENFDEIAGVGIAQHFGDGVDALVTGLEHFNCFFHLDAVYITNKVFVHNFAESAGKITGAQTTDLTHFFDAGNLVQILVDILQRRAQLLRDLFGVCRSI